MANVIPLILEKLQINDVNNFVVNLILAIIILAIGIILGKLVKFLVKKGFSSYGMEKTVRRSFTDLILTSIKWAIYLLFLDLALIQLGIATFTSWISSILVVFPALVGSLIIIGIGFAIAVYLKEVVQESKVNNWEILSNLLFYFILYIFMVFSLKTALIALDSSSVNTIIIILTGVVSISVAYWYVAKRKKSK